ncbi:MAG: hypothetical protein E3J94_08545 [Desulfobacteraceae bacterium]|nr:MAG: hypothetical protein E3J94_08545 [Desulfobacteraceae bacterium]
MNRNEIILKFLESDILKKWHWFTYHFQFYLYGREHPLSKSIVDAISNIDNTVPGFASIMIDRLSSISGKEKFLPHYEQLIQNFAELYVFNRVVDYFSAKKVEMVHEPTTKESAKNPEFVVKFEETVFGIEVKAPSLLLHMNHRYDNPAQISTRVPGLLESMKDLFGDSSITSPRDNPIKDFLLSANEKFAGFKNENKDFISLLFIVWDDFIYEPISAMLGEPSGLFLEGSFAKDENGKQTKFENVDAVLLDRHLINIIRATRDEQLHDDKKHAMDYGTKEDFPFKVIIPTPFSGIKIPEFIIDCFQLKGLSPELGAEYIPSDFIFWPDAILNEKKS